MPFVNRKGTLPKHIQLWIKCHTMYTAALNAPHTIPKLDTEAHPRPRPDTQCQKHREHLFCLVFFLNILSLELCRYSFNIFLSSIPGKHTDTHTYGRSSKSKGSSRNLYQSVVKYGNHLYGFFVLNIKARVSLLLRNTMSTSLSKWLETAQDCE